MSQTKEEQMLNWLNNLKSQERDRYGNRVPPQRTHIEDQSPIVKPKSISSGRKARRKSWEDTQEFKNIQLAAANLAPVASEVDSVYHSIFNSGPAGEFITNISGQETHYGHSFNPNATHSMGITQIDPIRYQDLLTDYNYIDPRTGKRGAYYDRINKINAYMQSKPGYQDWDMTKLATIEDGKYANMSKYASDPLSNYMTTRMMLMKDPRAIPDNIVGQAGLWKQIWNTLSGAGNMTQFADKFNKFRPVESTMYVPKP